MVSGRKVKKIVFINSLREAEEYFQTSGAGEGPNDTLFFGMNPSIRAHLKKKGVDTADTSNYFTTESHVEALRKSDELVKWLEANADFVDPGLGANRAYRDFFIYWVRFSMHCCIWAIEVALNAIEAHSPVSVCAYHPGKGLVSSLYIEPSENYFGSIIKDAAKIKGVSFINLCDEGSVCAGNPRGTKYYAHSLIKYILQGIKFYMWETSVRMRNVFPGGKPVFFTTRFYNLDKLANDFGKENKSRRTEILRGPVIFTFGLSNAVIRLFAGKYSAGIISQKKKFDELEGKIALEMDKFSYRGVSFAGAVSGKIKDNIGGHIMGLMLWTVRLKHFVDRSNAAAFISNGNRADDIILAELCRNKNIPTVLVSHGSHVRPKNDPEKIEWGEHGRALLRAPFTYLALQTPVSEGYLDVFKTDSKVMKTGPLIWGKEVERTKGDIKVIVHAGTPKPTNSLRLFVYETPDEYIRGIRELAEAVEKVPGTVLLVRFRPSSEIGTDDIKKLVPFSGKVRLDMEGPFANALGKADLLVSFSSTTIEEALQNRIPVLLYGGGGRYQHIAAREIKAGELLERSAIYHVSRAEDLAYAISEVLKIGIDGRGNDRTLFDEFIYPESERVSLEKIIEEDR